MSSSMCGGGRGMSQEYNDKDAALGHNAAQREIERSVVVIQKCILWRTLEKHHPQSHCRQSRCLLRTRIYHARGKMWVHTAVLDGRHYVQGTNPAGFGQQERHPPVHTCFIDLTKAYICCTSIETPPVDCSTVAPRMLAVLHNGLRAHALLDHGDCR